MDLEEKTIWMPTSSRIVLLLIAMAMSGYGGYLLSSDIRANSITMTTCLFLGVFLLFSIGMLIYAVRQIFAPKPSLVFDSNGISECRLAPRVPWSHVEAIEQAVLTGFKGSTSPGIGIRLIENSEYKSPKPETEGGYDILISRFYCNVPLNVLEQKLLEYKETYS